MNIWYSICCFIWKTLIFLWLIVTIDIYELLTSCVFPKKMYLSCWTQNAVSWSQIFYLLFILTSFILEDFHKRFTSFILYFTISNSFGFWLLDLHLKVGQILQDGYRGRKFREEMLDQQKERGPIYYKTGTSDYKNAYIS